jgi:predicted nuclease of restriction endonuclease-like (RecB) superfamily
MTKDIQKYTSETEIEAKDELFFRAEKLITNALNSIVSAVNYERVRVNFELGKMIFETEQHGLNRAKYGSHTIRELSKFLSSKFGRGYSETSLKKFRKFYIIYSNGIRPIESDELANRIRPIESDEFGQKNQPLQIPQFVLGWSHYELLMRIDNVDERKFYEIECLNNGWRFDEFVRQYNSSLYERLALSRDKQGIKDLSEHGHIISNPQDLLKETSVLEFLGLEENPKYSENDLEAAIIDHLQQFLLELGHGFLFEARQKRFSFDEDNFFVDLVFYNRLLQCYVLIDLKIGKLTHQDLGQMQMYVNYFDRYVRKDFESPTIGILLCKDKKDSLVELTLPKESNVYASKYQLTLPSKELLQQKLEEWTEEFESTEIS